ncbi:hypothetical protein FKW77_007563 [Venturia effusa]|uniref:Amino acid permease/ SLC12A domain-containing protein n=1 Tax=Venturia effusa TaxID=50376 RepID=A0A517KWU6_9PEZI|nr:hypothetical protein FKW77_007563 [Venturia effusa]
MGPEPKLKQSLRHYQIFFIALSGVIGGGIFNNNAQALELSGPGGLILSIFAMGIIAICVGECISELVQQFPAPNAIVEYVTAFVDKDFGWVVGIAYWYSMAAVFAIQSLAAAQLSMYWGMNQTWQTLTFYLLVPVALILLNILGVFTFGIVETIGGALKVCLVTGISIMLYVFAAQEHLASGPITDGFQNKIGYANDHHVATCYAIPYVALSFLGIEIVAVTGFEAKYTKDLRWPSRWIAPAVLILYLLCTMGEVLTTRWNDPLLPTIYNGTRSGNEKDLIRTHNIVINAALKYGSHHLAGLLNGCLLFSVISSANTSLYVSSRTLVKIHKEALEQDHRYKHFSRGSEEYKAKTNFIWAQPYIAWIGILGCTLVFAFTSAAWWDTPVLFSKVAVAYAAHIILLAAFLLCKLINRRGWVKLDTDFSVLVEQLRTLKWLKVDEEPGNDMELLRVIGKAGRGDSLPPSNGGSSTDVDALG